MPGHERIQQCIEDCTRIANDLRSLASAAPDGDTKMLLLDGARQVELCIQECKFASEMARVS